jgi:hypothetical protein
MIFFRSDLFILFLSQKEKKNVQLVSLSKQKQLIFF